MRYTLALITYLLSYNYCLAQDVIIYRNGDEVASKVLEIKRNEIVFKKFDNLNGPTYTENKNKIFMIKYVNGSKDVFKENTVEIQNNNEELYTLRGGELIPLYLKESVSSKDISNGTIVRFAVLEDIVGSNGKIAKNNKRFI